MRWYRGSSTLVQEIFLISKKKKKIVNLGDIKQLVTEYCILPLGNEVIRQLTPLVRSVLIAGPHGSGKRMLVNAVCTELGATMFDITPSNIVGKYPGKSGLIMLLHLISKVNFITDYHYRLLSRLERLFNVRFQSFCNHR